VEVAAMTTELRETGISVVGDIPWGTHFCYFYETKQDLLDVLVPYFKVGLENDEFCLWIISDSELLTMQEATSALRKALPDLDHYLAERSIEVVAHDEWFLNGGAFDFRRVANRFKEKLDEALTRDYVGMRVNGSPAWLYKKDGKELREFEEEIDKLFPNERVIASCTYPIGESKADFLLDVTHTHQFAIARRHGNWEVVETPELKQAKQEIKRLNEELEQRVIERTGELEAANEKLREEIVERKRAEEQLRRAEEQARKVLDTIPQQIWSGPPDGTLDYCNYQWRAYAGLRLEDLQGDGWKRMLHPEDKDRVLKAWDESVATGKPYEQEERHRRFDGAYRCFLCRGVPLRDAEGRIERWYGANTDITERKQAEEQLKTSSEQLRALSESLRRAREEEGIRIARELHDELGSSLTSLKWSLLKLDKVCSGHENPDSQSSAQEKIDEMVGLVDTTINTVRRISSELRPGVLDDLGLVSAIEWHAQQFQEHTGIVCRFNSLIESVELNREQSTPVFRIFQEAMTNVLRHAQATKVNIIIEEEENEFILEIKDNGRGITESERLGIHSLGLLGMRERAHSIGGKVEINGIAGKGTVLIVRLPINGDTTL
jgi:PAS domain S-box-containing protein